MADDAEEAIERLTGEVRELKRQVELLENRLRLEEGYTEALLEENQRLQDLVASLERLVGQPSGLH